MGKPSLVVGVGGSAGSLSSFERLLAALPACSGAAYVLIQHMDPTQKSLLAEILRRATAMPIAVARTGTRLHADHLYVCEPGTVVAVKRSVIVTHGLEGVSDRRYPIDVFLTSLAENWGRRAIGVVLSGTGTDGSEGLRAIKEHGGVTYVQEPAEAQFDGMPSSAIEERAADHVLPLDEIARGIATAAAGSGRSILGAGGGREDRARLVSAICAELHHKTGHDFGSYKSTTILRRVLKRAQACSVPDLTRYLSVLKEDPLEASFLLREFLISVTHFFRDPDAFAALSADVVPALCRKMRDHQVLRVWVPACATGEEAYTLAMVLKHHQAREALGGGVQIFATDIDRAALAVARAGRYPGSIARQIPPELLSRYFVPVGADYQVSQELRESCVFSEHNVIKDPPFSRVDLISCRNLFIYLQADLQKQVLSLFRYALSDDGYLFMGSAEHVSGMAGAFEVVDKKSRVFRKTNSRAPARWGAGFALAQPAAGALPRRGTDQLSTRRIDSVAVFRMLLETYAPPAVVVTGRGEVVFYSGRTGRYFEAPTGVPTTMLFDVAREPLRAALHALLHKATRMKAEVCELPLVFEHEGSRACVRLVARPLRQADGAEGLYLVVFQELAEFAAGDPMPAVSRDSGGDPRLQQLEQALEDTRAHLQTTIEQVRASNEELLSMNEELQAANEELQTSREELQSTNEELQTVNVELGTKVEELDQANSDLQNFLANSQVPTIFLDAEHRIQQFTPPARRIFRLLPGDTGRPITDIVPLVDVSGLIENAREVRETLQPLERPVATADGREHFMMQIAPYRAVSQAVTGVVVTFVDVTELRCSQRAIAESHESMVNILESMADAFFALDANFRIVRVNSNHERLTQVKAEDSVGRVFWDVFVNGADVGLKYRAAYERVMADRVPVHFVEYVPARRLWTEVNAYPTKDGGIAVFYRDVTEKVQAERAAAEAREQFHALANAIPNLAWMAHPDGHIFWYNARWYEYTGTTPEEMEGWGWQSVHDPDYLSQVLERWTASIAGGTPFEMEFPLRGADGAFRWFLTRVVPVTDASGQVMRWFGTNTDVSQQRLQQQALRDQEARLRQIADSMPQIVWTAEPDGSIDYYNQQWYRFSGFEPGRDDSVAALALVHEDDRHRCQGAWQEAVRLREPYEAEHRLWDRASGQHRWFMTRAVPVRAGDGQVVKWFGTSTDIDDMKRAQGQLAQALRVRDEFLSIASHELKTPLTSLKIQAQMRLRHVADKRLSAFAPAKLRAMFEGDDRQIDRLTRLIDDMLDVARINSGRLTIMPEPIDLTALVLEVVERFEAQCAAAGCSVRVTGSAGKPGYWDRFRMEQVVTNLLTNAIRYGAGQPVEISVSAQGGEAVLQVQDHGIGIAQDDQAKIFQQFERVSGKRAVSGLGLGLYIVRQILEAHGGRIEVTSEVDQGARFTVAIPFQVQVH